MMIKVSIIVCVYNMEKYLKKCLDSLVNQTLKEIEIIVVNDGSTDSSLEIIKAYEKLHTCIKVINQPNSGLGGARNKGLSFATGEYIGFVDADDFVAVNMYEKLYQEAKLNLRDVVICNYNFYPNQVKNKKKWFKEYFGILDANFIDKNTQPWNKIVKKDLIEKIKFRFFEFNGDGAYINLFLNAENIATINEELYYYRVGHDSMSTNHSVSKYEREVEIALEQMKMLKARPKLIPQLNEYFEYRIIYTCIQAIAVSALSNDKKAYDFYLQKITNLNYRKNKYIKLLLKEQFSIIKYFGIIYILPSNYYLANLLTKFIL